MCNLKHALADSVEQAQRCREARVLVNLDATTDAIKMLEFLGSP